MVMENTHPRRTMPSCTNPSASKVVKVFGFQCKTETGDPEVNETLGQTTAFPRNPNQVALTVRLMANCDRWQCQESQSGSYGICKELCSSDLLADIWQL